MSKRRGNKKNDDLDLDTRESEAPGDSVKSNITSKVSKGKKGKGKGNKDEWDSEDDKGIEVDLNAGSDGETGPASKKNQKKAKGTNYN